MASGGLGSVTGGAAGDLGGSGVGGAGGAGGEGGNAVGGAASGAGGKGAGGEDSSGGAGASGAGSGGVGTGGAGSGGTSGDNSGGAGGSPPTCDLEGFADRVRKVRTQGGTRNSCASPLPYDPVVGQEEALEAIRRFLSEVVGSPPDGFEYLVQDCGDPTTATCASRFQHDLYKSNGSLGQLLYPLAEELEACATNVSETIWRPTVDGITGEAIVCLSGTWNGELRGIAFFNGETGCP